LDTTNLYSGHTAGISEWTLVTSKKQVKGSTKSDKCLTEITDQLSMTSSRFTPLTNLEDQQVDSLSDSDRAFSSQTTHKTDTLYSEDYKIRTIVNGRIVNGEVRTRSRPETTTISGNIALS